MSEVITPVTVIGDSAIGGTATVDSGDISVVAGNLSAIDIVSNNIDSVVTDANNIDSINTLAASNSQLLNLNSNLSTIETVNSKLGEINRYYTTFLGSSATDPTVRVDGSPLQVGDMYYSTTMPGMKVRGATAWATSAGGVPVNNSTLTGNTSIQNLTVSNAFNANGYAQFNSSDAFKIPSGTTAQRPSPVSGQLRFNITTGEFEGFNGLTWGGIGGTTSSGGSAGSTAYVRQTFTATAGQTTFTITGGYTPGKIDVFKNGIKLVNGSTVTVTNGASVVLSSGATAGDIIDVVGLASGYFDSPAQPRRLAYTATAGQTLFNVVGGYTPNQLDVFQNGTKLVTGTDVDVSSGTTFTLVTPATAGDTLEVVGFTAADTISGTLKFHSGTASAPSITAFEDTDTGVYFPSANTLAVTTNGVQRVSVDGSGATSLTGNLSVSGTSTLSGNTSVTGNTTVGGTLGVTGTSTLSGNTSVTGTLGVTSNATVGGSLGVTGGITTGSNLTVNTGTVNINRTASDYNVLSITNTSGVQVHLNANGNSEGNLRTVTNHPLSFSTNNAEKMRIDSSGNVGIGTASPATKLHIATGGAIQFDRPDGTNQFRLGYTANDTALKLNFNAGSVLAAVDNNGNVGIGTTNPASKLDVYGVGNFQALELGKSGRTGNRDCIIDFVGDDTNTDYGLRIYRGGTGVNADAVMTNKGTGAILLQTEDAGPIILKTASVDRLKITSGGNVGVGTTAPVSKLGVVTSSSTDYGLISRTPVVGLAAGSYVNMAYFADSRGEYNDGLRIVNYRDSAGSNSGDWSSSSYRIRRSVDWSDGGTGVQEEIVFGNSHLAFNTSAVERLRIDYLGNVGIGTSAPTERLDVAGNAKVSGTITVGGTKVVRPTVYTGFAPASTTRTVEFTGIPAHVEEVTIILVGLGMNTTDIPYIQLGTASGYLGAGSYAGGSVYHSNTGINAAEYTSAAFLFNANAVQTYRYHGKYVITKVASNYWHIQGSAQDTVTGRGGSCNSGVSLGAGSLTRLKVEVGTGLFDEGSVYCIY